MPRRSTAGAHQFHRPSSVIAAGSSTARTNVASISTAAASPTPICLNSGALSVAKIANTATMTDRRAGHRAGRADDPCRTASRVGIPRMASSRIRLTTKTW